MMAEETVNAEDILPYEIWEKIFLNLEDLSDLKNLSEVCKYFNHIVGASPVMMDHFYLRIDGNSFSEEDFWQFQFQKKYKHMILVGDEPNSKIKKIFKSMVNFSSIHEILSAVTNRSGEIPEDPTIQSFYNFQLSMVPIITDPSQGLLTKLEIDRMKTAYIKELNFVLKCQSNLKELSLNFVDEDESVLLFKKSDFDFFNFHLERFSYSCDFHSSRLSIGVLKFIYSQNRSLEFLNLRNLWISQQQNNPCEMIRLEHLVYTLDFRFTGGNRIKYLMKRCPQLKTLQLSKLCFDIFMKLAVDKLEKLESLFLDDCDFDLPRKVVANQAKITGITNLRIAGYQQSYELRNLKFPLLKQVLIESSKVSKTRTFCVKNLLNNHNLDKLVIGRLLYLNDAEVQRILGRSQKLKILEIHNGSRLNGDFLNFQPGSQKCLEVLKIFDYPKEETDESPKIKLKNATPYQLLMTSEKFQEDMIF